VKKSRKGLDTNWSSQQENLEDLLSFLLEVVERAHPEEADSKEYLRRLHELWKAKRTWQEQKFPVAPSPPHEVNLEVQWGVRWRFIERRRHSDWKYHDWYRWTFYVRPSSSENADLLDRIKVMLDRQWFPKKPEIDRKGAYFEYTTDGWGPVATEVTLVLKAGWRFRSHGGSLSSDMELDYTLAWPRERLSSGTSDVESRTFHVVHHGAQLIVD
jgi:hypothetical protein